jgi:3-oxoacyl-[acyl-carrier protein] reductase
MSASPDIDEEFLNRAVVVTGAAGIIGGWIADAFFRRGARLVLSDRRGDRLEADRDRGRWGSSEVVLHTTDLRDPRSVDDLVRTVEATVGAPYAVVNNAGIYPHRPLLDVDLDHWDSVMETNVTAPYLITTGMARLMIAAGVAGSIVNIASGAATSVSPGGVAYSVSKAALVMLTRGAALELAPHGIRVNAVGPGFVPGSEVSTLDDHYVETMTASIPLGRTSGPEDAPEMVVYLCSTRAGFVTGNLIHVDGGRAAGPVGTKR